jgi:REase_MTES_1575
MRHGSTGEPEQVRPKTVLLRLARSQHGAFHLDQALEAGMTRRQVYRFVDTAGWTRPLPQVFSSPMVGDEWRQRVMAACLWARSGAASHRTAAVLWLLDGVAPGGVELTTRGSLRSRRAWLRVHQSAFFVIQRRDGIPVTTVARTLIDVGGVVAPNVLELALEDALRRRLTTLARLQLALRQEGGRGRPGTSSLAELVRDRMPSSSPTESELERRVLSVLAGAGLPTPVCQHVVELQGARARLDFAYPDALIAIEADGFRWHSGREAWSRDRTRRNALVGAGWRILHTTWADLQSGGDDLIRMLRSLLGQQPLI